jgi:hypothetical protein
VDERHSDATANRFLHIKLGLPRTHGRRLESVVRCIGDTKLAFSSTLMDGFDELRQRVEYALNRCQEEQWLEFKKAAPWEGLQWRLLKTLMAMANLRDGGVIVVGLAEQDVHWLPEGIQPDCLSTYDYDVIKDMLAKYASPVVHVDVVTHVDEMERMYLVFHVKQTHFSPVVCKKDSPQDTKGRSEIAQADIYVRPLTGRPRTTKAMDAESVNELLDVAAEQRARRLIESASRVGLLAPSGAVAAYEEESAGLVPLVPRVNQGSYWCVDYRPSQYKSDRICSLSECKSLVERSKVQLRGWDFPGVAGGETRSDANWIGAATDLPDIAEYWRLFLSGQFTHYAAVRETITPDWRRDLEEAISWHLGRLGEKKWTDTPGFISLPNLVYNVTEYFEFAARLVGAGVYSGTLDITVRLIGIQGFVLTPDKDWMWGVHTVASRRDLEKTWCLAADNLLADPTVYSLAAIVWLCQCFSWCTPNVEALRKQQQRILRG